MTRLNALPLLLVLIAVSAGCGDADAEPVAVDLSCAPPATDSDAAIDLYLAGLTEPNADARPCLLQRGLADDATLVAAAMHAEGRPDVRVALDELTERRVEAAEVRELIDDVLFRHQEALVRWVVRDERGNTIETGEDWIEFAEDGRIQRIHTAAGTGPEIPLNEALLAWERAWNLRDVPAQREALDTATTADVRFSDLLVDIQGRDVLLDEIMRQQGLIDGTLDLGDVVEVHAGDEDTPFLVRHRATITNPGGAVIEILNFIRLREGRIERLSGYPLTSL